MRFYLLLLVVGIVLLGENAFAQTDTILMAMTPIEFERIAPGVWRGRVGEEDSLKLSSFAGRQMDDMDGEVAFPFAVDSILGQHVGNRAIIRIPLSEAERVFGLGLHFDNINRRGRVHHLRVDHHSGITGRTHAPVPFYVTSEGYGVLFDTSRFISVYPGIGNRKDRPDLPPIRDRNTDSAWQAQPTSDAVEATVQGPGLDVIVFAGPKPLDAVKRYVRWSGGGALPPKWGLGFWHRTPTNASAEEIIEEVDMFRDQDFPLDVVGLEPGWQTRSYPCTFDWSDRLFPDPSGFVNAMGERGLHVNLWENPYVAPESSIYDEIKPYTGSHMVWLGLVPDYTMAEAREILQDHHKRNHLDIGVSGYKIDEVDGIDEWLWPDHAQFPSGTTAEQMRQTYGLQMQQMLLEMFSERGERTYGLVRGTNGVSARYPFALYSDSYSHRGYVAALCNSGFVGVLWSPEIRSARNEEEWVRRMQTACMSPLAMLNAWASGTKPWSFPEVNEPIRKAMKLRLQLVPYLYTAFAHYKFEGVPPFRSPALDWPEAGLEGIADQYMMGPDIMVAPIIAGTRKRDVKFPPGKWYEFETGELAGADGETISIEPDLDEVPLYVRDGALITLAEGGHNVATLGDTIVRHYGEEVSQSVTYVDDGVPDNRKGDDWYRWYQMTATPGEGLEVKPARGGYEPPEGFEVTYQYLGPK